MTVASSIVGGIRYSTPSAIFLIVPRTIFPHPTSHLLYRSSHNLPRTSFGKPVHNRRHFERSNWSNLLTHELNQLRNDLFLRSSDAQFQHYQSKRHFTLQLIRNSDNGAFSNVGVCSKHFLERAGG